MANKNAREIIVDILQTIEKQQGYSNIVLQQTLQVYADLSPIDKRFITEITNGTIKYRNRVDYVINYFSKTPVKKMKPLVRELMRMSVYQILFLDKVPDSAICNEAVKIVQKRRMGNLSPFVNGVLRNVVRNKDHIEYPNPITSPEEYLEVYYSFPKWLIQMWLARYSFEQTEELCIAMNESPDVTIRYNSLLVSKEQLRSELEAQGIHVEEGQLAKEALHIKGVSSIASLESFVQGYFTVQDESSMLATSVLDPKPGETIFDVCAAPGGKTTHIAERMNNEGKIISADIHEHKLVLIEEAARRMKHNMIETVLQDATKPNEQYFHQFDRILIDAPCSGFGIIRKKPDIRWKKQYSDIAELVKIQQKIIKTCSDYVKPNGIMVYSTCTISLEENEKMVEWIIKHTDFELESIDEYVPPLLKSNDTRKGYVQILPSVARVDGFFISRFRKRGRR